MGQLLGIAGERAAQPAAAPVPASSRAVRDWTVMVYMNSKNDMESAGLADLNEMEMVGSGNSVNVVVQAGRIAGYDASDGDWRGVRRYFITRDDDISRVASPVLMDMGATDMGSYRALADFGAWAKKNYPAKRYLLVVWNHGSGWDKSAPGGDKGISYDGETGNHIDTPGLRRALAAMGGADIVLFDACYMQMAEVAYELRGQAEYIVGSEEGTPWDGFPYESLLSALYAAPGADTGELAAAAVEAFYERYRKEGAFSTASAIRAAALERFARASKDWVSAVIASGDRESVDTARWTSKEFYKRGNRDLSHFLRRYLLRATDSEARARAEALLRVISDDLVVHSRYTNQTGSPFDYSVTGGVAVFLPQAEVPRAYGELSWAGDSGWGKLIKWYLR